MTTFGWALVGLIVCSCVLTVSVLVLAFPLEDDSAVNGQTLHQSSLSGTAVARGMTPGDGDGPHPVPSPGPFATGLQPGSDPG